VSHGALPIQAQALAAPLPPLLVAARRLAAGAAHGVHGRRRSGAGDVFWQFRPAQPGDAATAIDWRQSAKGDRLYLRETEWAAARTVWLWVDGSASMDWRSADALPTKLERTRLLALALAALLLKGTERVGWLASGRPFLGHGGLERLCLDLDGAGGVPCAVPVQSAAVLAGDFLMPLDDVQALMAPLGPVGCLLQVLDPAEEDFPYHGRVRFEGTEGEGELLVPAAQGLAGAYQARLAAHRRDLAELAARKGWRLVTHRTDQPAQLALLALRGALAGEVP
jgi:uncharacterized protein (DUF58 family)